MPYSNPKGHLMWSRKNKHKIEKSRIKFRYGITTEEYEELMRKQDGRCAICGGTDTFRRLNVDHCHASGKVRGLLCTGCNGAIGMLGDSIPLLRSAITYLEAFM